MARRWLADPRMSSMGRGFVGGGTGGLVDNLLDHGFAPQDRPRRPWRGWVWLQNGSQSDLRLPARLAAVVQGDHGGHAHGSDVHGAAGAVLDVEGATMWKRRRKAELGQDLAGVQCPSGRGPEKTGPAAPSARLVDRLSGTAPQRPARRAGLSPAGEALQTLPPTVARFRTWIPAKVQAAAVRAG